MSFPRYGTSILAWVAFIPLLFAVSRVTGARTLLKSYAYGFVYGFVSYSILLYWVVVAMHEYGGIDLPVSILGLVLLACTLSALYTGTFTVLIKMFVDRGLSGGFIFIPVLWVVLEYARTHLFSGFPWELLGYSQYRNLSLIQVSRITGVYGVSFVIMLFNVLVYEVLVWWYDTKSVRTAKYPLLLTKATVTLLLITGILVYGDITVNGTLALTERPGRALTVGLIQGDIDQSHKWDPAYQGSTLSSYLSLSQRACDQARPRLLIWPETSTPFFFQSESLFRAPMVDFVRSNKVYLMFGSPAFDYVKDGIDYFNSAFLMTPDGRIAGRYDKRQLVPFGEYLPLRRIFFFFKKLTGSIGDFTAGRRDNLLRFGKVRIGTLICYEIIFPGLSVDDVRNGANLLVTITDDAWFGRTSAPYQHLSMSVFRAVENDRFVVRSANTGISAVISPTGEVLASTKLFVPAFIDHKVRLLDTDTFYTRYGDLFVFICFIVLAVFMVRYLYTYRRSRA